MANTSISLPLRFHAAIARRSSSASPGVNPAATIDSDIACSWKSGTPSVLPRTRFTASLGYSIASSPRRRRR